MSVTGWHATRRTWLTVTLDPHRTPAIVLQKFTDNISCTTDEIITWYNEHFATRLPLHDQQYDDDDDEPWVMPELPPEIFELIRQQASPTTFQKLNALSHDTRSVRPESRFARIVPRQTLQRCRRLQMEGNTNPELLIIACICRDALRDNIFTGELDCDIDWQFLADQVAQCLLYGGQRGVMLSKLICHGHFELARDIKRQFTIASGKPYLNSHFKPVATKRYYPGHVVVIRELLEVRGSEAHQYLQWFETIRDGTSQVPWTPKAMSAITVALMVDMAQQGVLHTVTMGDLWPDDDTDIERQLSTMSQAQLTIAQSLEQQGVFRSGLYSTPQGVLWDATRPYQTPDSYCHPDHCDDDASIVIEYVDSINYELQELSTIQVRVVNGHRRRAITSLTDYENLWRHLTHWPTAPPSDYYDHSAVKLLMYDDDSLIYCSDEEYQRRILLYLAIIQ